MRAPAKALEVPRCARIRVVIALPHTRLREAVSTALHSTPAILVVAQTVDVGRAIESARTTRPDVVLLGTSLLAGDVAEGVVEIARALDGVPLVMAGHEDSVAYVTAVMAAGAAAYVPLQGDADTLAQVLRCAAEMHP